MSFSRVSSALEDASTALYGVSICTVNDSPTPLAHATVLRTFDYAIDELTERPRPLCVLLLLLGVSRSAAPGRTTQAGSSGKHPDRAPRLNSGGRPHHRHALRIRQRRS